MIKVLLLGGTGFIGRNIKESPLFSGFELFAPKRVELNLLSFEAVTEYLKSHKFDYIINASVNINSAHETIQVFNNFYANREYFGKFINLGSGAEYDRRVSREFAVEEDFGSSVPDDPYGLGKYTIANIIELSDKNFYNIRVFGVFGRYEDYTRRFISNNLISYLTGNGIVVNKNSVFDYIFVDDLVRCLIAMIDTTPMHKSYNFCSSRPIQLTDLAKIIANIVGYEGDIHIGDKSIHSVYCGSNNKFTREYPNFQFTALETAISSLYDWYLNNRPEGLKYVV